MLWSAAPSPQLEGLFAVVRHGFAFPATVEVDGFNDRSSAAKHARKLTEEFEREQARLALLPASPYVRKLPPGLYSDQEAP